MIGLVHNPKLIDNIRAIHVHIVVLDVVETEELDNTRLFSAALQTIFSVAIHYTDSAAVDKMWTGLVSYVETASMSGHLGMCFSRAAFVVPLSFSAQSLFFSSV